MRTGLSSLAELSPICHQTDETAPSRDAVVETRGSGPDFGLPLSQRRGGVVAIIPARGGSKGLPRKNARPLCGKPLVSYSIEAALRSRLVDRVVVSTDDDEIFGIAKEYDSTIPLKRPPELATDGSGMEGVVEHVLRELSASGYNPVFKVVLLPTHPFRNPRLLNGLIAKGLAGHSPVQTVRRVDIGGGHYFIPSGNGIRSLANGLSGGDNAPRAYYRVYGLFDGNLIARANSPYMHVLDDPVSLVDIDYLSDFLHAEDIIREKRFNFELE